MNAKQALLVLFLCMAVGMEVHVVFNFVCVCVCAHMRPSAEPASCLEISD